MSEVNEIWSMYVGDVVQHKKTGRIGKVTSEEMIPDENKIYNQIIWVDGGGPYFRDDFHRMVIALSPSDYSPSHDTQTLINRIKQLAEWNSDEALINHALQRYLDGFHGAVSREEFKEHFLQANLSSNDPRKRD